MTATMLFTCNICGEESSRICGRCTKDTCDNHLCAKCLRCSDCCECEVMLDDVVRPVVRPPVEVAPEVEIDDEMEDVMDPEPAVEEPIGMPEAEPEQDTGPAAVAPPLPPTGDAS